MTLLAIGRPGYPPLGQGGEENTAKIFLFVFQPSVETGERRDPTHLTRRGNSNVLVSENLDHSSYDGTDDGTNTSTRADVFVHDRGCFAGQLPCLCTKTSALVPYLCPG